MRQVSIPELKFSPWYRWENREEYPLANCAGVYLIAISKKDLEGVVPSFADVVYIGITVAKKGLKGRWGQLDKCVRGLKGYHSGGKTIYKDKGNYEMWAERLYVSGMGIECDVSTPTPQDYHKMGWVAFLEYDGFAKFASEIGGHPKYNKR